MAKVKRIKVHVDTGFVNASHTDYWELPENWDEMTEKEKEKELDESAKDYKNEVIESYAEVVEIDESKL